MSQKLEGIFLKIYNSNKYPRQPDIHVSRDRAPTAARSGPNEAPALPAGRAFTWAPILTADWVFWTSTGDRRPPLLSTHLTA
jgi:hypothetical protein